MSKDKRFLKQSILAAAILVVAGACSGSTTPTAKPPSQIATEEAAFAALAPADSYNTVLRLTRDSQSVEALGAGYSIDLDAENHGGDEIVFPLDYGIQIHTFDNVSAQWDKVPNNSTYAGVREHVLAPHGVADAATNSIWIHSVPLYPDIPVDTPPVTIRVSVIGTVYHDDKSTGRTAGAYIDITLPP